MKFKIDEYLYYIQKFLIIYKENIPFYFILQDNNTVKTYQIAYKLLANCRYNRNA